VAAVLDPEHVRQFDPGLPRRVAQCVRDRVDQGFGPVSNRRHRPQPLRADDADGMRGDVRSDPGTRRVGQVVAEAHLDPATRGFVTRSEGLYHSVSTRWPGCAGRTDLEPVDNSWRYPQDGDLV